MLPLLIAVAMTILLTGALLRYTLVLPNPLALRQPERAPMIRILARDGSVLAERGGGHDFMPLERLPRHVIEAVIATEDRRFFEHWGIDHLGLIRAIFANLRAGRYAQGGSTITQQLAKNLFLTSDRRLARKVEEFLLAIWLEMRLSKADILEIYLNRVYFGGGAYGIEAAARRYFDKSARDLSLAEAAVVAGLLKAPSKYSPSASPGHARARARLVLAKMLAAGFIDAQMEAAAREASVRFAEPHVVRETSGAGFAVDFVLERMPTLVTGNHREVIVETTIDAALQLKSQTILAQVLASEGEQQHAGQGSLIVLDLDGGIRAMIGGRSYAESQFNRAVKARRQPGSAWKPIVYLAALEAGLLPETTVLDIPINIAGWAPRNEDGRFRGPVTLRQSLALSLNTVAARLQQDIGARKVVEMARRLGIRSEISENPTLALGTSDVSLMELAGAYGAVAAGGVAVDPHIIKTVRTSAGRVLYRREEKQRVPIIAPDHVSMLSGMLAAVVSEGTARRAAIPGHPTAGKTGTTQDNRDAWFVGYTGHLVGGVWVGNDNGQPMANVTGGSLPARIWLQVMSLAHARLPPQPLKGVPHAGGPRPVPVEPPAVPAGPLASGPGATAAKRAPTAIPAPVSRSIPADPLGAMRGLPPVQPADAAPKTFDPDAIARLIDGQSVEPRAATARPPGMMSLGNRP